MTEGLPPLRRVVTTHDEAGVAVVKSDQLFESKSAPESFGNFKSSRFWTTESVPAKDNNQDVDGTAVTPTGDLGLIAPLGTNLCFTEIPPGGETLMHRTSSLDYNILTEGTLVLVMEDGSETVLNKPGSVVVQRGTIHAWKNPGPGWTRWVSVLVGAEPAVVGGKTLGPDAYPIANLKK